MSSRNNQAGKLIGAVLAGGRARRFGSDKAMALLGGKPLMVHAAEALGHHTAAIVVCGRELEGYHCLPDRPAPDLGPLGGLNAALRYASDEGYEGVLCTGCDMPVFPAALASALVGDGPAIVEGQFLMGYWPAALSAALDAHLREDPDRSVRAWLAMTHPCIIPAPPLPNINTPDDLRQLETGG